MAKPVMLGNSVLTCNRRHLPSPERGAGWPLCSGASWLEVETQVEAAVEAACSCAGNNK